MNSSQALASSGDVDFFIPRPITCLPFSLSFATSGEKSLSPETITNVSMCSLLQLRSMASTTSRMSAEFLPVDSRRGISISSIPFSCRLWVWLRNRFQSAYATLTMTLPFSSSRSRMRRTSKGALASRRPSAMFSKSMNTAICSCGPAVAGDAGTGTSRARGTWGEPHAKSVAPPSTSGRGGGARARRSRPGSALIAPGRERVPDGAEGEAGRQPATEAEQAEPLADRERLGVERQRQRDRGTGGVAEPAPGGEHLAAQPALAPGLHDRFVEREVGLVQRDQVQVFELPVGFGQGGVDRGSADEGDEDLANCGAIHREPRGTGIDLRRGGGGLSRSAGGRADDLRLAAVEPAPELRRREPVFRLGDRGAQRGGARVAQDGGEAAVAPVDRRTHAVGADQDDAPRQPGADQGVAEHQRGHPAAARQRDIGAHDLPWRRSPPDRDAQLVLEHRGVGGTVEVGGGDAADHDGVDIAGAQARALEELAGRARRQVDGALAVGAK